MPPYVPVVKFGLQLVTGLGVGRIIGEIVKNNVPVVTRAQQVQVVAGTWVIAGVIAKQTTQYVDETTDDVVSWLQRKNIIKT